MRRPPPGNLGVVLLVGVLGVIVFAYAAVFGSGLTSRTNDVVAGLGCLILAVGAVGAIRWFSQGG